MSPTSHGICILFMLLFRSLGAYFCTFTDTMLNILLSDYRGDYMLINIFPSCHQWCRSTKSNVFTLRLHQVNKVATSSCNFGLNQVKVNIYFTSLLLSYFMHFELLSNYFEQALECLHPLKAFWSSGINRLDKYSSYIKKQLLTLWCCKRGFLFTLSKGSNDLIHILTVRNISLVTSF